MIDFVASLEKDVEVKIIIGNNSKDKEISYINLCISVISNGEGDTINKEGLYHKYFGYRL